jgi:hydroxymethylglutaryl-CoA lyase
MDWPTIVYTEEVMREGFGIEDARIPLTDRVALLEALSDTGLKRITVGAFVSARYVPQMADFERLLHSFQPRRGVAYLTFLHNDKAREQALHHVPPLTVEEDICTLFVDMCDVHQRRNVNRSIEQVMATWPDVVDRARDRGVRKGRVGVASAWGSNFLGLFSHRYRIESLARQIDALASAGMDVFEIGLHDSQSFCLPHEMERDLIAIKQRWPQVRQFHLHMHDARGMALPSLYAALRVLERSDTLLVDGTLGGIGGGQYCGNGAASAMVPTEDFMHMLDGMGMATGVDFDRLIECVWMLERIIGRPAYGHVSKAGPRPIRETQFYDPNLPAIETPRAARHFKLGRTAYEGESYSPWRQPIVGPWYPSSKERTSNW